MKKINRNIFKPFMFVCLGLMAVMLMSAANLYDPPGKPGKPEAVDVGNDWCTIKFTPPASDGGSPITSYIVEYREEDGGRWVPGAEALAYKITVRYLTEGKRVEFRVSAVNKAGQGPPSDPSDFILIKE